MIKIENLNDREFIKINDLTETLGTSQNTIYRLCIKGDLKPYKFLGKNYWRCDEVKSYLINLGVLRDTNTINKQLEINETTI
jgi:predicted DNA-binding transcriptional regulator AlpA